MMAATIYKEEECFNVYWQIKNFSFCCKNITSPVFSISGSEYYLQLLPTYVDVHCMLAYLPLKEESGSLREISFLTCDDSQEESISSGPLRVPKDAIFGNRRKSFLPEDTLTVRLRYPNDSERGKLFIRSQIGVKRSYFLWTLKNFSTYQGNAKKSVEESQVYGNVDLNFKSIGGFNTDQQLYIEISRTGGERCKYTLEMSILDVDGKALNEVSDEFVFEKIDGQQIRAFPIFFKRSKLLECKNLILPENTLSLKCNIAVSLGTVADQSVEIRYCENAIPLMKESDALEMNFKDKKASGLISELPADLKSALKDGTLFDASLQIGSDVIQVHKIILSARSPVFKAIFTKNTKGKVKNTVVIEDLDIETMRRLVLYMYTDTITDCQWGDVKKLYSAADKYEVLSLKRKCVSFMVTNLSISNVCEVLVFADLQQDGDLKTTALDFISEYDSEVFGSEAWKELGKNNSSFALQVISEIYRKKRTRF